MTSSIILATSRINDCAIGGKIYSGRRYGDVISTVSDDIVLKGSTNGRSDKAMHQAFANKIPVLVCLHHGRNSYLPCPVGIGFVTEVREGTETKHEFKVKLTFNFGFKGFAKAEEDDKGYCWIKRQFMRTHGLKPRTNSHMRCFIHCDIASGAV